MSEKLYSERDEIALDKAGNYYIGHVVAMTKEGLHDKCDIAAELGYRDMVIDQLQQRNAELVAQVEQLQAYAELWINIAEDCAVAGTKTEACEIFEKALLNKSPAQCLSEHDREVAARAVERVIEECQNQLNWQQTTHYKTVECFRFMNEYANKIKSGEVEL